VFAPAELTPRSSQRLHRMKATTCTSFTLLTGRERRREKKIYSTFRYHLWAHIAADASLKMTDSETKDIVIKVRDGLDYLAKSLTAYDKAGIYTALVKLVSDYLKGLNKGR